MRIAHVISPVRVPPQSDLFVAQPIVFESMERAKTDAESNGFIVDRYAAVFEEDRTFVPNGFTILPELQRSVRDVMGDSTLRKFPLIGEIITRAADAAQAADILVYTNVDIILADHFYDFVARQVEGGVEAGTITRMTVPGIYNSIEELEALRAGPAVPHEGHDCFFMPVQAAKRFVLGKVSLGLPGIDRVLLANLYALCPGFREFHGSRVTFHIGDDGPWRSKRLLWAADRNSVEVARCLRRVWKNCPVKRRAEVSKHCPMLADFVTVFHSWQPIAWWEWWQRAKRHLKKRGWLPSRNR